MEPNTQFIIYLFLLTLSFITSVYHYKSSDGASRIISLLLGLTVLSETISYFFAKKYHNNMPVYHFFNPVELFMVALYFNMSIDSFRKRNIGIYIGLTGIILSTLNTIFLQPLFSLNSYFLLFEGFCIISMALFSYREMFEDEQMIIIQNPHFWFSSIFLFVSGVTYTNWALYSIVGMKMANILPPLNTIILIINMVVYTSFGLVFLFVPSKK